MVLVKPATVIRGTVRDSVFWRWHSKSGRPLVEREIRDLIRQMRSADALWRGPGSPKVGGLYHRYERLAA
jgi:hypothetical protein